PALREALNPQRISPRLALPQLQQPRLLREVSRFCLGILSMPRAFSQTRALTWGAGTQTQDVPIYGKRTAFQPEKSLLSVSRWGILHLRSIKRILGQVIESDLST